MASGRAEGRGAEGRRAPPVPWGRCQAVIVLGKELRQDPVRARRELRARAAAAALVRPRLAAPGRVLTLEAPLRGQPQAGSVLVRADLADFGVPPGAVCARTDTRSTREEALGARRLLARAGLAGLVVVTAAYHQDRAARIFAEVLGVGQSWCCTPEGVVAALGGPPALRAAVAAAVPTAQTWAAEGRVERLFSGGARLLQPLPAALRWGLEVRAGALLRGARGD